MARIRTIKPEFWSDEKLSLLPPLPRIVFIGLISLADDAGRLVDNVKQIDGQLFPNTDDTSRDSLDTLARLGRITRYTSQSGQALIQVVNWPRHQKVDKPSRHVLPGPDAQGSVVKEVVESSRDSSEDDAKGSRDTRAPILDHGPRTMDHSSRGKKAAGDSGAKGEPKTTWITPFADAWRERYGGEMAIPQATKPLKKLVDAWGVDETLRRWGHYLAATEGQFANAHRFASTFGQWNAVKQVAGGKPADAAYLRAAQIWPVYLRLGIVSNPPIRTDRDRIANELHAAFPDRDKDALLAEIRIAQPWTLNDAKTDHWAIERIAERLRAAGEPGAAAA